VRHDRIDSDRIHADPETRRVGGLRRGLDEETQRQHDGANDR
jgi:hypothetical protein